MATTKTGRITSAFILKGKDGRRLLGLITSNAYVDRDAEALSLDALKSWVNSAWRGGMYRAKNTLLFWHAGEPIGDVIWSDMRGAFLVEIAKEHRTPFAKAIFDQIERGDIEWGVSHGFRDKAHDFDGRLKVYRRIDKKETSVLPLAFAANPFTEVRLKNMNLRLAWLKKNAPEAVALEKRLTTDAKERQRKLDRAGVTRKEKKSALNLKKAKPQPKKTEEAFEEKAIDPASLAENLTSLLGGVFADAGVEAPEDLNDRIAALIESLDSEDAPVDVETVAEAVAETADELLADEGAEAPDDLQEQIAEVINEEEAVEEEVASRKSRRQRQSVEKRQQEQQTSLLEELLDDLSVIGEIGESLGEVSKAVKQLTVFTKELNAVKAELRQIKRKMGGGPRAASDDDESEVDDEDEGGDDADDVKQRREFKRGIQNRKNKSRAEGMFGDLFNGDEE